MPIGADQEYAGTLIDLFSPYALLTGLALLLLCMLHGAVYLCLKTSGDLRGRAVRLARALAGVGGLAVLALGVWTVLITGGSVPAAVFAGLAVLAVLAAFFWVRAGRDGRAFAATSVTIAAVVASIFAGLYPRVMVSTLGPANDLTVAGTTASPYALTVITVVAAVLLPIVLVYQAWSYRVFRGRIGRPAPVGATADRRADEREERR